MAKKIDPGLVGWAPPTGDQPGHYLHGEDWVQLVQDNPDDIQDGDGHYELYSGDPNDYVHAR